MAEAYPVIEGAEEFFFKGSEVGVLISHGFLGTPQSVRYIGEEFASLGYSVLCPRLQGHGTHYEDLEACSYQDWFSSLEKAYLQLKQHCSHIFVIGQSMGGTLSLRLAHRYKEIKGLVLINAALQVPAYEYLKDQVEPRFLDESDPDIHEEGVHEITYSKVPLKAVHELQNVMKGTLSILPEIESPVLGIRSSVDHVVPPANTDYILQTVQSTTKERLVLENSFHVASMDYDKDQIVKSGHLFIQQIVAKELVLK
ncbi:alpha/beta hydrolase [Robertmurraya korlensis]|uniref:alpha/beta hydrolase n=1 Tax=Robertmurraya korlensis TaxID=519977 RepID=UPI0008262BB1|nr:alpha/beta fold hydrolase [Robertmurraya korlensis]